MYSLYFSFFEVRDQLGRKPIVLISSLISPPLFISLADQIRIPAFLLPALTMAKKSKQDQTSTSGSADTKAMGFPPHLLKLSQPCLSNVETLIPNAMFVMHDALTPTECKAWIAHAEENNGKKWDMVSHPATKYIAHRE